MSFQRLFLSAVFLAIAAAPFDSRPALAASEVTTPSGLRIIDVKPGTGPVPQAGQTVTVNYTGWLFVDGKKGKKFDSSLDRNQPFSFTLGQGQVIKGWDEGLATMHVGGKRTLIIPPDLGYGASGAGGDIPPNATLIFDVDLLDAK
jgi:peptidylprolyl isomerase